MPKCDRFRSKAGRSSLAVRPLAGLSKIGLRAKRCPYLAAIHFGFLESRGVPDVATRWKVYFKGFWVVPVCQLISCMAILQSPFRALVGNVLGVPDHGDSPARYLQEYVADGVSAGAGLLLILALAAFTWRRNPYWTIIFAVFPAWWLLTPPIAYAVVILWRCLNLVGPSQADSLLREHELVIWTHNVGCWSALALITFLYLLWYLLWRFGERQPGGAAGE